MIKIIILHILFISLGVSQNIHIKEFCALQAKFETNKIVEKSSDHYEYVLNNQLDNCLLSMRGVLLSYPKEILKKSSDIISDHYTKDLIISPDEFVKVLNHTMNPIIDIKKLGYTHFSPDTTLSVSDIKRKECERDTLSVFGIKLGCRYDHQKSMKITNQSKPYDNKDYNLIIPLSANNKPYQFILLYIVPSSGIVSKINLALWNPKTGNSTLTHKECINISNSLINKYSNKFSGKVTLAKDKPNALSDLTGAQLETKEYTLNFWCSDAINNAFDFVDKKAYELYKEEMKIINYNKNINNVFE